MADATVWQHNIKTGYAYETKLVDNGDGTYSLAVDPRCQGAILPLTPVISAGAIYASGDNVGGLLTFPLAARWAGGGGFITNMLIIDDDKEKGNLELWLFNQTFTQGNDNAVWTPVEAEMENLIGILSTADGTWFDSAGQSVNVLKEILRYDLVSTGTSLFGRLVTRSTQTYTAVDDLTVKIGLLQD